VTWHVGRLIDHVHLIVSDLGAAARFYAAVLESLELPPGTATPHYFQADELFVSEPYGPGSLHSHVHLAFQARDRAMVDAFYRAALDAGGRDNGAPGERPYHPGYYAAFVLDPDGNNIEAVFHGPSTRSAADVTIEQA
jgi:catechol 2,3-dioxygenase-like lactoylglutathione lyase family enzyme